MSHDATRTLAGNHCVVHKYHWPKPLRTVVHHIHPQEYGGKSVPENLVKICDNGHYNVHTILDALLDNKTPPMGTKLEHGLAQKGYEAIKEAGLLHEAP